MIFFLLFFLYYKTNDTVGSIRQHEKLQGKPAWTVENLSYYHTQMLAWHTYVCHCFRIHQRQSNNSMHGNRHFWVCGNKTDFQRLSMYLNIAGTVLVISPCTNKNKNFVLERQWELNSNILDGGGNMPQNIKKLMYHVLCLWWYLALYEVVNPFDTLSLKTGMK